MWSSLLEANPSAVWEEKAGVESLLEQTIDEKQVECQMIEPRRC